MVYVLSASTELFPSLSSCKALSETYWASYFHQASLGTHLNYQFFSNMTGRCKDQQLVDAEVCLQSLSVCLLLRCTSWTDRLTLENQEHLIYDKFCESFCFPSIMPSFFLLVLSIQCRIYFISYLVLFSKHFRNTTVV